MISINNKIDNYSNFSLIYSMFCSVSVFIDWIQKWWELPNCKFIMINLYIMLECFNKNLLYFLLLNQIWF